ncbi:mitochondrial 54S ribosomal protein YmL17/YmL30 [Sugiyamaella lignohabitans]|uniref:Large ribosomal subunit protein mL46 n=1 Tax=Sugiyamaella lignohabitans TaxID=796027 RepID=A0A167E0M2_9ASCO|nr:mitochondrial 54S ribosomal protein YmL17/YmL30 [Sugiyamaella lignohabitans]ANB13509.1 mitochondrial 54S ribosomal protein YmL17/YmL30 [Sugiyamaella lignohabitans]
MAGASVSRRLVQSSGLKNLQTNINNSCKRLYSTETDGTKASTRRILAGLILSRTPVVTPELTEFEKAYYHYQDELERRLMWTFPSYYYFKKGSLRERQFNAAQRGPVPRHANIWYPKGIPDIQHNRERRLKQEIVIPRQSADNDGLFGNNEESDDSLGRPIVLNSRHTEADEINDTTSLKRKLDRTLYLVVKEQDKNIWRFPAFSLEQKEPLHIAAERGLRQIGGVNINTWTVSNTPAGVTRFNESGQVIGKEESTDSSKREFYIKSHILHGKFVPQDGQDFAWLTREELGSKLDEPYYNSVEPLLSLN